MKTARRNLIEVTLTAERPGEIQSVPTYRPTIFISPEVVTVRFEQFPAEPGDLGFVELQARGPSYRLVAHGERKPTRRTDEITWHGPKLRPDLHDLVRQLWRER